MSAVFSNQKGTLSTIIFERATECEKLKLQLDKFASIQFESKIVKKMTQNEKASIDTLRQEQEKQ